MTIRRTVVSGGADSSSDARGATTNDARQTVVSSPAPARRTVTEPGPVRPAACVRQSGRGADRAEVFRALRRPPMALLIALDDGCTDTGETWRIRKPQFIIGRIKGDCCISHDPDISGQHVEISFQADEGRYRWFLRDLKSTNGTFLRVQRVTLRHGGEYLIGGGRFTFRKPDRVIEHDGQSASNAPRSTSRFQGQPKDLLTQLQPKLIQVTADGDGQTHMLTDEPTMIGSDPAKCRIAYPHDPFLDPCHVQLNVDHQRQFVLQDKGTTNGIWRDIQRYELKGDVYFQIGGQRFLFRTP